MSGFEVLRARKLVNLTDSPIGPRYNKEGRKEEHKDEEVEYFFDGASYFLHVSSADVILASRVSVSYE